MHSKVPQQNRIFSQDFGAFLFDMDGTLVNSIAVVERVWREWAVANGIEPDAFLQRIHGMRASEVIRREAVPGLDIDAEADMILRAEMDDVDGIIQIPGAAEFLATLPASKWAIVTSAVRELAERRLAAAVLPGKTHRLAAGPLYAARSDAAIGRAQARPGTLIAAARCAAAVQHYPQKNDEYHAEADSRWLLAPMSQTTA